MNIENFNFHLFTNGNRQFARAVLIVNSFDINFINNKFSGDYVNSNYGNHQKALVVISIVDPEDENFILDMNNEFFVGNKANQLQMKNKVIKNQSILPTESNNISFTDNLFDLGSMAILAINPISEEIVSKSINMMDGPYFPYKNISIIGNSFMDQTSAAIKIYKTENLLISENSIENKNDLAESQFLSMIFTESTSGSFEVSRNNVSGKYHTGMTINSHNGDFSNRLLIANNMILETNIVTGFYSPQGLFLYDITYGRIYHNTIKINSESVDSKAFHYSNLNSVSIRNNIFVANLGLAMMGTIMEDGSDYNSFYSDGEYFATVNDNNYSEISTLQATFVEDGEREAHSVFYNPEFVSATDLHLSGSSLGNPFLTGFSNSIVTEDFDGDPRDQNAPYMGADEASISVPVTLSAFSVQFIQGKVILKWETTSELNNYGFEIETKTGQTWSKVGFVAGNGTTTEAQSYSFVDNSVSSGIVSYRLKQIDFDGKYEYSTVQTINVTPETFELLGNYPNPFNPMTVINFQMPKTDVVTITVYDVLGRQLKVLLNEERLSGKQHVSFDATGFSSGLYFYQIKVGTEVKTGRMLYSK